MAAPVGVWKVCGEYGGCVNGKKMCGRCEERAAERCGVEEKRKKTEGNFLSWMNSFRADERSAFERGVFNNISQKAKVFSLS